MNTLNRATNLRATLESFRALKYDGKFEVIVINGPSTDETVQVLEEWKSFIKIGTCPVANLSVSRNMGIKLASGEIVAFIDDDAIPEPEWLAQLAAEYVDSSVGAVGGFVFDNTGYEYQYRFGVSDRFGNTDQSPRSPSPLLNFPGTYRFPHLLGCNSSFRRSALFAVGGFDEEIEYYLDETDLCARIVDAGYKITQLESAFVHHKFAPSSLRNDDKVLRRRFPVIKNKIYFIKKHGVDFFSPTRIEEEIQRVIAQHKAEVEWLREQGKYSAEDVTEFEADLQRAIEVGRNRGDEQSPIHEVLMGIGESSTEADFFEFQTRVSKTFRTVALITRDYPPGHNGGVASFMKDLAESLALGGDIVHVITESDDHNRVDFENNVWVHRLVLHEHARSAFAESCRIPQNIWNWSATALEEVNRIASHRQIDVVEAPIWDCEGVAFIGSRWPLVTSLQTTLAFWLQTHAEHASDAEWMEQFGSPVLNLERIVMEYSHGIRGISKSIIDEIEREYNFEFNSDRLVVSHLGLSDTSDVAVQELGGQTGILFVGRLEARKGIDVLLHAIPSLATEYPDVPFTIVGDNKISDHTGQTYFERFRDEYASQSWFSRVRFTGKVTQEDLINLYRDCLLFVGPSRFESFGLIYLEAMREGKPAIGSDVGGVPEIIVHGKTGLLTRPGDSEELKSAIKTLLDNSELRTRMGKAGREVFEKNFGMNQMVAASHQLYDKADSVFQQSFLNGVSVPVGGGAV